MGSFAGRPPIRRGFTLVEMLIVVAVLATIAAVTLPALIRPLAKRELQDAAAEVRVELAKARLEAIESGVPRQFRFQPGTGVFEVSRKSMPVGGESDLFGGFGGFAENQAERRIAASDDVPVEDSTVRQLPHGILFWTEERGDRPLSDSGQPDRLDNVEWSAPIIFYPNGRTSNAHLRLHGLPDYCVDVTLRGLTGAAKVGRVLRLEREEGL